MTTEGWIRVSRADFALSFAYPATVDGREVMVRQDQRPNFGRVHLSTEDKLGLYFEVTRFAGIEPQGEYDSHRAYLEQRFGAGAVSALTEVTVQGAAVQTYSFHWETHQRLVLLIPVGADTYRILYDPTIALNDEVLATVELGPRSKVAAPANSRDA